MITKPCETCGEFYVSEVKAHRKYCSLKCRKPMQRHPRLKLVCKRCGAEFERLECQISGKGNEGRGQFCSKSCAMTGRPINGRPSKIATDAIAAWAASSRELFTTELRVDRFSIDLALPLRSLAIELDGCYWHSLPAMIEKDARKDAALRSAGWRVVHITIPKDTTADLLAGEIRDAIRRDAWEPLTKSA